MAPVCPWVTCGDGVSHVPSQASGSLSFPSFLLLWCPSSGVLPCPPSIHRACQFCSFLWLPPWTAPPREESLWNARASCGLQHNWGGTDSCVLSPGRAPRPLVPSALRDFDEAVWINLLGLMWQYCTLGSVNRNLSYSSRGEIWSWAVGRTGWFWEMWRTIRSLHLSCLLVVCW